MGDCAAGGCGRRGGVVDPDKIVMIWAFRQDTPTDKELGDMDFAPTDGVSFIHHHDRYRHGKVIPVPHCSTCPTLSLDSSGPPKYSSLGMLPSPSFPTRCIALVLETC